METRINLEEGEIPSHYYNILADMPNMPDPVLHPGKKEPIGPEDLAPLFPMELIKQEVSTERFIKIPDEVRDVYKVYRPTPLIRARLLEKHLETNCKIFFKNEAFNAVGSHKINTAIAQVYYNKKEGVKRITTETGAGQWGSAVSFACSQFGLDCQVYMVSISYRQKPYRRVLMQCFGADIEPSPSNLTQSGKDILAKDPNHNGSLGIAISEAVEDAAGREDSKYALGSVLNHVLLHQTIIGQETKKQFEKIGLAPDTVIGCVGGGSNMAGLAFPYLKDNFKGGKTKIIAVEPKACPSMTKGKFAYDFGDTAHLTPLVKMYTLGAQFVPPGIHAGGLRYHGTSPIVSQLIADGYVDPVAYNQSEVFEAALTFARTEGIVPAPETAHAIKAAIEEAKKNDGKTIVFNLSGHGYFDMGAYEKYLAGDIKDVKVSLGELKRTIAELPKIK